MFYRLVEIAGRPLPTDAHIDGHPYPVHDGGVLLEPPSPDRPGRTPEEGFAILSLFGRRAPGETADGFLAQVSEPYRRTPEGDLDVSRGWASSTMTIRLLGRVTDERLVLRVVRGGRFLPEDTELVFVAAPGMPIPTRWQDVLYFGPPQVVPQRVLSAEEQRELDEYVQREDATLRAAAAERLARAWVTPG